MTPAQFQLYLIRDQRCWHCGTTDDTLVPQHRIGRGMGGKKKKAERPSNILVLCSLANGLLESDAAIAETGRRNGWKLSSWQDPSETPAFDTFTGAWFQLDDEGRRTEIAAPFDFDARNA